MRQYTVYQTDGTILRSGRCGVTIPQGPRVLLGEAGDDATQHVEDGRVVDSPEMPVALSARSIAADGAAELTISGIPQGASARVRGPLNGRVLVTDGELTITTDAPGRYQVTLDAPKWQRTTVSFDAT